MSTRRQVQTPGVTTPKEETKTTTEKADEALAQINAADESEKPEQQASPQQTNEPTTEELQRQLPEMKAQMKAQMDELKKSTQVGASVNIGSTGEVKPKKRVPVLTEKGWTTKEAD
ncbi:hypothetical protein [Acinetobacter haemolyticus]|uniref:hypothetical protein n=1 Tax=Acinetobacter haemolyticus TaxID=29430 RepID=UPI0013725717|nr:hypothetical protein [Acinetobacter haemolyticus]NAR60030.1 hypothetical protein [Acinetobacter haemolyticus]NAR92844.1 hypothetical protein [Acinetobacter haemolyticus]